MSVKIKYILFDAANTLIHKPDLWTRIMGVFNENGINISVDKLKYHHKILSEHIEFPDQTSKEFYAVFNKELLISLGIEPEEQILDRIFEECTYLPWKSFDDTEWLKTCDLPMGVLSNFNSNLIKILNGIFGNTFQNIFVSEQIKKRKPEPEFYQYAIENIGVLPQEILYIGDSLKLDVLPAKEAGMRPLLVDRVGLYSASKYYISSLKDINNSL